MTVVPWRTTYVCMFNIGGGGEYTAGMFSEAVGERQGWCRKWTSFSRIDVPVSLYRRMWVFYSKRACTDGKSLLFCHRTTATIVITQPNVFSLARNNRKPGIGLLNANRFKFPFGSQAPKLYWHTNNNKNNNNFVGFTRYMAYERGQIRHCGHTKQTNNYSYTGRTIVVDANFTNIAQTLIMWNQQKNSYTCLACTYFIHF